jgi:hypothetical protein
VEVSGSWGCLAMQSGGSWELGVRGSTLPGWGF